MVGKTAKALVVSLVYGLCATAMANTTGNPAGESDAADAARTIRISLLLPAQSETFGAAAQALRAGFMAAFEREPAGIEVNVVESAEGAQNVLQAFRQAQASGDIVVGPLARADVAAVAALGKLDKPTLTLAQPEAQGDADVPLPPGMLAIGLSIEDEARQAASWAGGKKRGKAFAISAGAAWQRRAARAFALQWQERGQDAQLIDIANSGGYLNANGLALLKKRLQEERPVLLFLGLDATQAQQLQSVVGQGQLIYGTSQVNPWSAAGWIGAEKRPEMNGVRLLDMPWQIQSDHPAAMVYPRWVTPSDQRTNPDLERLYALGIDAYRVAREIAARRSNFELDGVTGRLTVKFGPDAYQFRRSMQPAVYQGGMVAPLPMAN